MKKLMIALVAVAMAAVANAASVSWTSGYVNDPTGAVANKNVTAYLWVIDSATYNTLAANATGAAMSDAVYAAYGSKTGDAYTSKTTSKKGVADLVDDSKAYGAGDSAYAAILYTYGSYLKKDADIEKNTTQVEWFDTGIAILAGLMIIPAVFAFSGGDMATLKAGPSLMFITLPKVFDSMGMANIIGSVFFFMVLFAALTSSISLFETSVSTIVEELGVSRLPSCLIVLGISLLLGTASVLGYGALDFVRIFGMQVLDFFDFLTNSLMMPVSALFTCILILRVVGFDAIAREVKVSSQFRRQGMYHFVMKYIAPFFLIVILLSSIASVLGWITF